MGAYEGSIIHVSSRCFLPFSVFDNSSRLTQYFQYHQLAVLSFWLYNGFVFYRCHYDIKPTHNVYFVNEILLKPEFLFGCGNLHTHI